METMRRVRALALAAAAVSLAAMLAGCTGASPSASPSASPTPTPAASSPEPSTAASPTPTDRAAGATPALIAQATTPDVVVYTEPDGERATTVRSDEVLTAPEQTPLVFLVEDARDGWLEVLLPVRPNGTTGWLPEDQVILTQTTLRIEVSLSDFTLTVYDGESEVMSTPVGLGQDHLPTPGGTYFIRELLEPPDPDGIYGPYAYGLSGYSPVLDSFAGGDAVIGIHGTDEPELIGQAVPHGCIRVENDAITRMVEEIGLPLGTPVLIEG